MPLSRRLPKRGFRSRNRVLYAIVNVGQLSAFEAGTVIDADLLRQNGMIKKGRDLLKVLAEGELAAGVTVRANKFSKSAADKIAAAGGSIELIEG